MYIDEEKKFIFFHNPKTGGTTINTIINEYTKNKYVQSTLEIVNTF